MDKVRFAVVGVGGFGLKRINSILRSEVAELAYVLDANEELARNLGRKYSINSISFDELLSRKDYDVTIVAVPNVFHYEIAVRLLELGRDVWCEKPMTINIDLAYKMVMKSIEKRAILKVGSNPRYFPNVLKASDLIKQGFVGNVLFFRGWIGNEGLHLLSKSWYRKREMVGGGTLIDNGVHLIDLIRHLADEIITCYGCRPTRLKHNLSELEDNAAAIYGLSRSGFAFIHSSWTERSGYMYFELHGDNGYIHVDSRWSKAIIRYSKSGEEPTCEDFTQHPKLSYDLELEDFVRDYREGFHPKPTSYDGYRSVKIIMQSYQAAATQSPTATFDSSDEKLRERFLQLFNVRET